MGRLHPLRVAAGNVVVGVSQRATSKPRQELWSLLGQPAEQWEEYLRGVVVRYCRGWLNRRTGVGLYAGGVEYGADPPVVAVGSLPPASVRGVLIITGASADRTPTRYEQTDDEECCREVSHRHSSCRPMGTSSDLVVPIGLKS